MATTTQVTPATGTPAWHEERATGIGGSEVAALYNVGWGCRRRLFYEKRAIPADYQRPQQEQNVLDRGNELEDIVADKFTRETSLKIRRQGSRVSKTHSHARVNMDRQIIAVDASYLESLLTDEAGNNPLSAILGQGADPGPGVLECKTINEWDFKKLVEEGFAKHEHYVLQLQHALAVTGYKWGMFAFLEPTWFQFKWFVVVRHDALCASLLDEVERAWAQISDPSCPLPEALEQGDKRCAKCLYRKTCRGEAYLESFGDADREQTYVVLEDPELLQLATDFNQADANLELAEQVKEAISERVKAFMQATGVTKVEAAGVKRFIYQPTKGQRRIDSKAVEGEIKALKDTKQEPLVQIATRLENCWRNGAPGMMFRPYEVKR